MEPRHRGGTHFSSDGSTVVTGERLTYALPVGATQREIRPDDENGPHELNEANKTRDGGKAWKRHCRQRR